MKRISKILGVVLTVALLASLVLMAAPASAAATLQWNKEGIPSEPGMLTSGADITDVAVAADGTTIYVATGLANDIYKSTNGGISWTPKPTAGADCTLVAVAPDNSSLVVAAGATDVYVSTNGGASWKALGAVAGGVTVLTMVDIDVSAAAPNNNLAVADGASVWVYDLGIGGAWVDTWLAPWDLGQSGAVSHAVAFSPNFASDQVLTAVTDDATDTFFEVADMSGGMTWNAAPFPAGGVVIESELAADAPTNARIALAPTYLGSDEVERVGFVSVYGYVTDAAYDGIYRVTDTVSKDIKVGSTAQPFQAASLAYDGSTLATGANLGTAVWRCTNALDSSPTFAPSAATKSPSGNIDATAVTTVAFAGTNVVAGTTGAESAFSVSTDGGKTFADVSLIDCEIGAVVNATGIIDDFAVSADSSKVYLLTEDTTSGAVSLWRFASNSWQRVLCVLGTGYIVRTSATNADVVYVIEYLGAGKTIYYSKDGGVSKWYNRIGPVPVIADLAVESDSVAYCASGATVWKSANGGFTWAAGPPATLPMAAVYTLKIISEGNVLAGSTTGDVALTTDGNANWAPIPATVGGLGQVNLTATGLASGDYIFANEDSASGIYRWQIGQEPTAPWLPIETVSTAADAGVGIALQNGTLYALGYDPTVGAEDAEIVRSTMPVGEPTPPPMDVIATAGYMTAAVPSALRVSTIAAPSEPPAPPTIKLWTANIVNTGVVGTHFMEVYSYQDTLALVSPALSSPITGTKVLLNSLSGNAYDVSFTWPAIAGVTGGGAYQWELYLDAGCTEAACPAQPVNYLGGPPVVATVQGPNSGGIIAFMPGTAYYWRVKAALPISSGYSEVRTFTIDTAPAVVPTIASPSNGAAITSTAPSFSWNPIAGTTKYTFQLTDDASFAATLVDTTLITTAYQSAVTLEVGKTYFWRVKALEPVEGDWSSAANFAVVAPAATTAPETNITVPNITIPPITVPPANVTVEASTTTPTISAGLLWAVIIIGAVLVIALIVLIVRTRRTV